MSQLKFEPINLNKDTILVVHENGAYCGELYREVDGYWVWWPNEDQRGFVTAAFLREMADKLDELNDAWDQEVKSGLAQALSEHLHGDDDTGIEWPG